ncbi:hypothetical protein ACTXT7_001278 [Hymenolepis weldensis]
MFAQNGQNETKRAIYNFIDGVSVVNTCLTFADRAVIPSALKRQFHSSRQRVSRIKPSATTSCRNSYGGKPRKIQNALLQKDSTSPISLRKLLQEAQQFTCVIIGRMAHGKKVALELSEIVRYIE